MNERLGNLVLSRKAGQTIVMGDTTVTVVEIRGGAVKLSVRAPQTRRILRGELLDTERSPGQISTQTLPAFRAA